MFDASAPKGILSYWKTEYLRDLDDAAIEVLVARAGVMGAPFSQMHLHHLGGAVGRVAADATAFGRRDLPFVLNCIGMTMDPAQTAGQVAWVRETARAAQPFAAGGQYLNFLADEGEARVRSAYGEAAYARLARLKAQLDPTNLFRLNQNIVPA